MRRELIGLAGAVLLVVGTACGPSGLVGAWTGRDELGRQVTYSFLADATGFRTVDSGTREPFTYEVTPGYPTLIEITLGVGTGAEVRRGLVEIVSDIEMRLDLAEPGMPVPPQLSLSALTLRRPPSR